MKKPSVKSLILASLTALVLGLLQPMTVAFSMALCTTPILVTLLYAWAGAIPAVLLSVCSVGSIAGMASIGWNLSPALAGLAAAVVLILPGAAVVVMMNRRVPFFRRMLIAIGAQIAAILAFICVIYLGYRIDLVDTLTAWLRKAAETMPADMLTVILNNFAINGLLTQESIEELTGGIVTYADVMQVLDQAFEYMNYQMKYTLPAMLINSGLLSGVLMTALPAHVCARRGDDIGAEYVPVTNWFMPSRVLGGAAVCIVTSIALQLMKIDGAVAATTVISTLCGSIFLIQGVAALTRRMKESGSGRGARTALIVLAVLFASRFVEFAGICSALIGRKGVITNKMRQKMEERRKDEDE